MASARLPRWLAGILMLSVCLGVGFRLYHLDRKVLWEDEIFATIHLLGYTEADIVRAAPSMTHAADLQRYFSPPAPGTPSTSLAAPIESLAREDPQHPPLYYLIAHIWSARAGSSVSALRTLSALLSMLALPCMYVLCRELFGSRGAGLIGAALVALSPFEVLYAQEVREYGLWTAAILLVSLAFARALRLRSTVAWALYAAALAVSMYVFPFSGFVALGFGVALLALCGIRSLRSIGAYLLASGAGLAFFVPWLVVMVRSEGLRRGMSSILTARATVPTVAGTLARNVRSAFIDFGLYHLGPLHSSTINLILTIVFGAFFVTALVLLVRSDSPRTSALIPLGLCLAMLPVVARDAIAGGGLVNQSRYFIPLYLGIELAAAAFFARYIGLAAARGKPVDLLTAGAGNALAGEAGRRHDTRENESIRAPGAAFDMSALLPTASLALLLVLLTGGALSCAVSSRAETWANKDYEQNRAVAHAVNAVPDALVVSDFDTSRMLGLGYYLDPGIGVRLNLHCDQCSLITPPRRDLLDGISPASTIFLLGPSAELARSAKELADRSARRTDVRTIGVATFFDRTNPLTLFAPLPI